MGDTRRPDRAITIDEMLKCQELLETDWKQASSKEERFGLAKMGVALCVGYSSGLRGEELAKMSLGGTLAVFQESVKHPRFPHVTVALRGRFKGETGEKNHHLILVPVTRSGLGNLTWVRRLLVNQTSAFGTVTGQLLGPKARIRDLDPHLHGLLRRVQRLWPEVLGPSVDIEVSYSFGRSIRRGSTAQAQNVRLPREVIEANQRWRKVERAKGKTPGFGMMETYTDVRAALESLLRYSEPL
jgi:hypothetical protein